MLRRRISLALTLADAKAPTELRIFGAGWTDTTKGMFLFDADAAASVMKAAADWGNRYSFDYQHSVIDAAVRPEDKKSAASFLLELRDGPELWAVDIQWAKGVDAAIEGKEWLYFSPLFMFDPNSRRVLELLNIALTNDPATKNMTPLLAAARFIALGLGTSAGLSHEELRFRLQRAVSAAMPETSSEWNCILAVYEDNCVFERAGKLWSVDYSSDGAEVGLTSPPIEVRQMFEPASQQLSRRVDGISAPSAQRSETMDIQHLVAALGLKSSATETEVLTELQALRGTNQQLLAQTGAGDASAALGAIAAWKTSHEELPRAQGRVAELERGAREKHVDELLDKGRADRKVTPAMLEHLRAKGLEDPKWLEAFLAAAPAVHGLTTQAADPIVQSTPVSGKNWAELRPAQRAALYIKNRDLYETLKAGHQATP